ncbi:hypothetical protein J4443_00100 [Candidatus Woesearchaeota archaeon]|nr:hypothetical protein [Candidatus Woesearchaeota archaeon]
MDWVILNEKILNGKRGISELIVVVLLIAFIVVVGTLIFMFASESFLEESQKSSDRSTAQDICRSEVKIRVGKIKDSEDFFAIEIENLKERTLNDFLVRYERDADVEIKKAAQVLNGYEKVNVKVEKPSFQPRLVKVIPQIILEDELETGEMGWWLCSGQTAVYTL